MLTLAVPPAVAGASSGKSVIQTSVMADYYMSFYDFPYFVAQQKGYYKSQGLSVTWIPGTGSNNTVTQVATGKIPFGMAAGDAVAEGIAQGEPITAVANIYADAGWCAMVPTKSGITSISQLSGHTYAAAPGSDTQTLWPAVLKAAGLSASSVTDISVSFTAALTGLFEGQYSAAGVPCFAAAPDATITYHIPVTSLLYSSVGVNTLGMTLFTSNSMIKNHPAEVRAFVQGTLKGFAYTKAHISSAYAITKSLANPTDFEALFPYPVEAASLKASLRLFDGATSETKGFPLGCMSTSEWANQDKLLSRLSIISAGSVPAAKSVFTNSFLATKCPS
jgi:NitT/TauT family transport system substrate-binding protein